MDLRILSVPYDTARRGARMGAGPEQLLRAGLVARLGAKGHHAIVDEVAPPADAPLAEIRTAFDLARGIAGQVRRAVAEGRLPIVLAGNCNSALGTLAGLGARETGVLWFDAHGDFNTPETTLGGFLDGMALATATGRCWTQLAAGVPGFAPVPERHVLLLGARDLDSREANLLAGSEVRVLPPAELRDALEPALLELSGRVRDAYVHIDLDVLDPSQGRANAFAAPAGLTVAEALAAVRAIGRRLRIRGGALTAFDPSCDDDGRAAEAALLLIEELVRAASEQRAAGSDAGSGAAGGRPAPGRARGRRR